jgi:hypothetical protein
MLSAFSRIITAASIVLHCLSLVYAQEPVIAPGAPPPAVQDVASFLAVWDALDCGPVAASPAAPAAADDELDLTILDALDPAPLTSPRPSPPAASPDADLLSIFGAIRDSDSPRCGHTGCNCTDCDGENCRCTPRGGKPAVTPQVQQKLLNASGVMIQANASTRQQDVAASLIATLDGIRDRPRLVAGVSNPTRQQAVQHLLTAANHRGKFTAEQLALLTDQQILELHEADHDAMERGVYRQAQPSTPAQVAMVSFPTHEGQAPANYTYRWRDGIGRTVPQHGLDYPEVGLKSKPAQPVTTKQPAPQQTVRVQSTTKQRGVFARMFNAGPRCVGGVCYQ